MLFIDNNSDERTKGEREERARDLACPTWAWFKSPNDMSAKSIIWPNMGRTGNKMLKSKFTNHVTHIKPQISTDFHRCGNLWVAVGVVLAKGRPQISTDFHRCGNMWFYVGIEFLNNKKHDDNTTSSIWTSKDTIHLTWNYIRSPNGYALVLKIKRHYQKTMAYRKGSLYREGLISNRKISCWGFFWFGGAAAGNLLAFVTNIDLYLLP